MHEVLVNRLGGLSLPRKSVVRLTDRPDMTLDVYSGRKTTMQHVIQGRESRGLNDRVHGFSGRYSDKTYKKINYISTNIPTRLLCNKCTYLLIIPGNHSSKYFSTMCSSFSAEVLAKSKYQKQYLSVLVWKTTAYCGVTFEMNVYFE